MSNFKKVEDAVTDAEYLMKKNMIQFGWSLEDHPPEMDEEKPEYSRFWFVKDKGKETAWSQEQRKQLQGNTNLKSLEQLQQGCSFMEGLGWKESPGHVKYTLLMKEIEQCKSTY